MRPPAEYIQLASRGKHAIGGEEWLSDDDQRLEGLLLGLRTSAGILATSAVVERMAPYVDEGLATRRNGRIALTERGMLLANELVLNLV